MTISEDAIVISSESEESTSDTDIDLTVIPVKWSGQMESEKQERERILEKVVRCTYLYYNSTNSSLDKAAQGQVIGVTVHELLHSHT